MKLQKYKKKDMVIHYNLVAPIIKVYKGIDNTCNFCILVFISL